MWCRSVPSVGIRTKADWLARAAIGVSRPALPCERRCLSRWWPFPQCVRAGWAGRRRWLTRRGKVGGPWRRCSVDPRRRPPPHSYCGMAVYIFFGDHWSLLFISFYRERLRSLHCSKLCTTSFKYTLCFMF